MKKELYKKKYSIKFDFLRMVNELKAGKKFRIRYHRQTFLVGPYFRPKGDDGCFLIAPKLEMKN